MQFPVGSVQLVTRVHLLNTVLYRTVYLFQIITSQKSTYESISRESTACMALYYVIQK